MATHLHPRIGSCDCIEPHLISIHGTSFLMGSASGQDCERPVHRVWVNAFQLGFTQVTNQEYQQYLRTTAVQPPPFWNDSNFNHPLQPVAGVSWFEAESYCQWLASQTGRVFRLPNEAEWECAARGGIEQNQYPWGNEPPQSLPDYAERWQTGPEQVAKYAPNAFGIYNLCDNVHEWCSDWYDPSFYAVSPNDNPTGPEQGRRKTSRGGSWRHHVKVSRCSARSSIPPNFQYADYGFRVACGV